MNGLSHPYHLDEPTSVFRDIRSNFPILFHFLMKIISANRIAPDGTPHFASSHLGLICLPMSHRKDARLIWVKPRKYVNCIAASTREIAVSDRISLRDCVTSDFVNILFGGFGTDVLLR